MKNRNAIFMMILFALGSLAFLPTTQAVSPAPDGGYPGGNTAEGQNALLSLTAGTFNTAVGLFSLLSNTDSSFNTAIGAGALLANTAFNNTATGAGALLSNTTGEENTANGAFALFSNTEGLFNTGVGAFALQNNTTGFQNTAIGNSALVKNAEGDFNTAIGDTALFENTTGDDNTATGEAALERNTAGSSNTAVGDHALGANTTGNDNVALGVNAGQQVTTASNVICIGRSVGGANLDNSCFIGNIRDAVVAPDATQVMIDSAGKLGTTSGSSRRFKSDIKPMCDASEAVLALKPVTFHYKSDNTNTPQFGLIAEQVAQINPDLVVRDKDGQILTVRYDAVNAMLLNEFLKEHRKVEEQQSAIGQLKADAVKQEATTSELKKNTEVLTAELKKQAIQIQEVSTEIEMRRSVTRVVLNP
jgi:hypothetical protein